MLVTEPGGERVTPPKPAEKAVSVPAAALERLLAAAEAVGGQYEGVHPVLRECHEAAIAVRKALE